MQLAGWRRPIRDDATDHTAHGDVDAATKGCASRATPTSRSSASPSAPRTLKDTADAFEIATSTAGTADDCGEQLPWASYGQAEVLASPFRMARVAATMAARGEMLPGRWVLEPAPVAGRRRAGSSSRRRPIASRGRCARVVTGGTASSLAGHDVEIAGKTGTAEVAGAPSHSWFVGFAPATGPKRIAIAVIVENGGYGARAAVPLAGDVVSAARSLGMIP